MPQFLVDILIYIGYFIVLVLGVLSHFFKKKIKGETITDIKQYFTLHFKNTITTCIAAVVLFSSLIATGASGILPMFFAGYTADSLFNKADEAGAAKLNQLAGEEDRRK
jgi:hypothetical protein